MKFFRPLTATAFALTATLLFASCGAASGSSSSEQSSGARSGASGSVNSTANFSATDNSASASATSSASKPAELVGGGTKIFPDRRFVALYGSPDNAALGVLGEYEPVEAVNQVKTLAQQYQPFSKEKVQPAFEIITTIASSEPGGDGDYSREIPVKELLPLIEEAEKNGVYVVLDLQPGRDSFVHQVTEYQELFKRPNVGLGIDPEWRLGPNQVHLQQIGTVDAAEINETLDFVANLVKQEQIPQKLVVLHQFTQAMITNRELVDTSHPELALTMHADGHGIPDLKKDTYNTLLQGLPQGIYPSWKNFYEEDTPTLTPEQTYALNPAPWVVTYQ
ncbi:MAG: hypothetical protein Q3974_01350 [Rothia sp. (in: high G+C Gram-positive bacteria)]|nr:hypothetical protein [Rothia sp. (in: high G+C Gram-positive bacteria)]